MPTRLFLFAAYNKNGKIDKSVEYYLRALSQCGDIIFIMDAHTDKTPSVIKDIPNILYTEFVHHGEYDFGSYKRAYNHAYETDILKNYEWIYFVNDSVFGPLTDMNKILNSLENKNTDLVGIVSNRDKNTPFHIQSWFIGMRGKIASSDTTRKFIQSIRQLKDKNDIITKYEIGFSKTLLSTGVHPSVIFNQDTSVSNTMYRHPYRALSAGVPFIKKSALKHSVGIKYLSHVISDPKLMAAICEYAKNNNIVFIRKPLMKLKLSVKHLLGICSYTK